jgi:hypothetical protein
MSPRYCFWSVCDGAYGAMMERCVRTARAAGVFKEFHVLCDRPLAGCESYDAYQIEKARHLFKLHYLKVGMSRLNFDYFVWLDADTMFLRHPLDLLKCLGKSPIHVPLELDLSTVGRRSHGRGRPAAIWWNCWSSTVSAALFYLGGAHFGSCTTMPSRRYTIWHSASGTGPRRTERKSTSRWP